MSPKSPKSPDSINSDTYEGDIQGNIETKSPTSHPTMSPKQPELFHDVNEKGDVEGVLQGTQDNLISDLKDGEI
jgi:hypothetical protein